jgi:hypothetical protein
MLTGESDPPFKSRYGGRDEYDPVDRDFNRQFDDSPRGRQPWDSDPKGNPLERDPLEGYDYQGGRDVSRPTGRGFGSLGNIPPRVDSRPPRPKKDWWNEPKRETGPSRPPEIPEDGRVYAGGPSPIEGVSGHDYLNDPKYRDQREKYKDSAIEQKGVNTSATQNINKPAKTAWTSSYSDRLKENYNPYATDPKDYDLEPRNNQGSRVSKNSTLEGYRKDLQYSKDTGAGISESSRVPKWDDILQVSWGNYGIPNTIGEVPSDYKPYKKPQVTPATQDLSGITGRLSELEGRQPSWQEDRIKALEERKPDTSWKDPLSTLQTGQQQGQQARTALDTRLAALEDYYKKDPPPPPEERLGSRYEDKQAQLNKMWEQSGNVYDPEAWAKSNTWQKTKDDPTPSWFSDERKAANDYVRNKDWYGGTGYHSQKAWAKDLPDTYRKQMRDLDKEYNKPSHSAIIKGREYTAYGPAAGARLKMLDEQNIHEDEYLGHGTWQNKFGEEVTGRGKSTSEKRYFTSHSGLDPEGEEYAKRFRRQPWYQFDDDRQLSLYQRSKEGTLGDYEPYWKSTGGYRPEEHGKHGWGVVGTNRSKTGQTKWDEAYYPELG